MIPTLDDIISAKKLIAGSVMQTPFLAAPKLSLLTGADVRVKYENLQVTNSFKDRGALVKLLQLNEDQRARGVIAMSAGNHAQAVAYHSQRLGIPATIVMPEPTPFVKVANTRAYGAKIVLSGETLADSQVEAERLIGEHGYTLVHPYDDPHVIAGQGTIGLEMLDTFDDLDTIIVPIGGGGLISGVSIAVKATKPSIEIVGVEVSSYASVWSALRGETARCGGNTLAEGIAVKNVGKLNLEIIRENVSDIVLVDEPDIERAVNAYLTLQKTMAEGAGAAGLAAMLSAPTRFAGRKVGLILCGGNIDARILASIMVRELVRQNRVMAIRITIPDRPGVLGDIASLIGDLGGNILEVEHHRLFLHVPAKGASLDVTVEMRDAAHGNEIVAGIEANGFLVDRLDTIEAEL